MNWIEIITSIVMLAIFFKIAMILVEEFYEDDFE